MDEKIKNIINYFEMARRHKWILIIFFVVFTGAAIAISGYLPVYYRSMTLILVERQQVPEKYVMSTDKTPFSDRLSTISQQILSRSKLEQVLRKLNIYDEFVKELKDTPINNLRRKLGYFKDKPIPTETVIEQMRKRIVVKVIGRGRGSGDAFRVSYIGRDPATTQKVTNTLASLFISENIKVRAKYVSGTTNFITEELTKAKKGLEGQEKQVRAFKEKYMGGLPEQIEANLKTLDRLQISLQANDMAIKNAKEKVTLLADQIGPYTTYPDGKPRNPAVMAIENDLNRLHNKLSILLSEYKEDYPDVLIVKNRIKDLEVSLKKAQSLESQSDAEDRPISFGAQNSKVYADLKAGDSELTALLEQKVKIEDQIKLYEKRVEDTPANEQKLADLRRDYDISFKNYQSLLEKKMSAQLAENLEERQKGERFRVMDPAYLPIKPYKTYESKVILLGMIIGLGLGGAIVFLLEIANPVFRKPDDLTEEFNLPVLAVIPNFHLKSSDATGKAANAKQT